MQRLPNRISKKTDNNDITSFFEDLNEIAGDEYLKEASIPKPITKRPRPAIKNKTEIKEGLVSLYVDAQMDGFITKNDLEELSEHLGLSKRQAMGIQLSSNLKHIYTQTLAFLNSHDYKDGNTYGTSFSPKVVDFINWFFSEDLSKIDKVDKVIFNNSISCAALIFEKFKKEGNITDTSYCDLGDVYAEIRKNGTAMASQLAETPLLEDKWCPADIYLYSSAQTAEKVRDITNIKDFNGGTGSFISYFDTKKSNKKEVVIPISLKQQLHKEGQAKSFSQILNKGEHYTPEETKDDKERDKLTEILTTIRLIKKEGKKYWLAKALGGSGRSLWGRFSKGYKLQGEKGIYTRETFDGEYDEAIVADIEKTVSKKLDNIRAKAAKEFADLRRILLDDILHDKLKTKFKYDSGGDDKTNINRKPNENGISCPVKGEGYQQKDIRNGCLDTEIFMKKFACYKTAIHILGNFVKVGINENFKTLSTTENPLAALTAFAIGMAGFSPTFYKVVGSDTKLNAKSEIVYGAGKLEFSKDSKDSKSSVIYDVVSSGEFQIEFFVEAFESVESVESSKKYKTRLNFQGTGSRVVVEVIELKKV